MAVTSLVPTTSLRAGTRPSPPPGFVAITNLAPTTSLLASPPPGDDYFANVATNVEWVSANRILDRSFWRRLEKQLLPIKNFVAGTNLFTANYYPLSGLRLLSPSQNHYANGFYIPECPQAMLGCIEEFSVSDLTALADAYTPTPGKFPLFILPYIPAGQSGIMYAYGTNMISSYGPVLDYVDVPYLLWKKTASAMVWRRYGSVLSNYVCMVAPADGLVNLPNADGDMDVDLARNPADVSSLRAMWWYWKLGQCMEMATPARDRRAMARFSQIKSNLNWNVVNQLWDDASGLLRVGTNTMTYEGMVDASAHDVIASAMAVSLGALYPTNRHSISSNFAKYYGTGLEESCGAVLSCPTNEFVPAYDHWSFASVWYGQALALDHPLLARDFWQKWANYTTLYQRSDYFNVPQYSIEVLFPIWFITTRAGDFPRPHGAIELNAFSMESEPSPVYGTNPIYIVIQTDFAASDGSTYLGAATNSGPWYWSAKSSCYTNPACSETGFYYEPDASGAIAGYTYNMILGAPPPAKQLFGTQPCWVMTNSVFHDPEGASRWCFNLAQWQQTVQEANVGNYPVSFASPVTRIGPQATPGFVMDGNGEPIGTVFASTNFVRLIDLPSGNGGGNRKP